MEIALDKTKKRRQKKYNEKFKGYIKSRIWEYLNCHPCVDCGEKEIPLLDFDHVRGEKKFNISTAVNFVKKWNAVLEEIEKCEVRCSNCHRKKTKMVWISTTDNNEEMIDDDLLKIVFGEDYKYERPIIGEVTSRQCKWD